MTLFETVVAGLLFLSPAYADAKEEGRLQKDLHAQCLALNMYHEARGQGSAGLLAVSSVVLNRVRDKRYVTYTVAVLINTESIRIILIANAVPDHTTI